MAKRIFAFIMAAVLACTAFAGCTAQKMPIPLKKILPQLKSYRRFQLQIELYASGQS